MKPESLLGKPAKDVILAIVETNPHIEQMEFVRYTPNDPDQADLFWHYPGGIFVVSNTWKEFLDYLTSEKLQSSSAEIGVTSLAQVTRENPDPNTYYLGHKYSHIPLLDLDFPFSSRLEDAKSFLKGAGQTGWLLNSGNGSFHFYGARLMPQDNWLQFLSDADREGILSRKFFEMSINPKIHLKDPLATPYSTLRITNSPQRPQVPTVIDII